MSSRLGHTNKLAAANGQRKTVGADEDMFLQAFEETPKLEISTPKDLECEFIRTVAIISNSSADWDKRVDAIKRFRSLLNCGIADCDDFYPTLRTLEIPFQNNISDLRSQVVRETCITLAYLSCRLQQKFSRMAEVLFPSLIKLIPNSAKIMSTSATVAIRFIIQSTHNSRLIPIIRYQLSNSKSKEIRRALCEFVERIVHVWPANILEKHLSDLQEVIKLGICDSDEQARIYARRAFNGFADLFRDQAEQLYNSLDLQRQRMLNSENNLTSMSNHGSTNSVNNNLMSSSSSSSAATITTVNHHSSQLASYQQQQQGLRKPTQSRLPPTASSNSSSVSCQQQPSSLALGSVENLYTFTSRLQKISQSRIGLTGPTTNSGATTSSGPSKRLLANPPQSPYSQTAINLSRRAAAANSPAFSPRSTSAIDVAAQRRAKARANYLSSMYNRPRQIVQSTAASRISPPGHQAQQRDLTLTTMNHHGQSNYVSHNQPTSLIMTSPISTAAAVANVLSSPGVTVRSSRSRVSQSQPGSRSTSPSSRYNYITNSGHRRRSGIPVATSRSTSPNSSSVRDSTESYYSIPPNITSNNFSQDANNDLHALPVAPLANLSLASNSNTVIHNNGHTTNSYSSNHYMSNHHHHYHSNGQSKHDTISSNDISLTSETLPENGATILSAQKATQYLKSLINGTNSTSGATTTNNNNGTSNNGSTEAAIKFLTKLIEHHSTTVVCNLLDDIMPSLIKAYDNPEAAVRKEAVFAMVAIYGKVGAERMEPHLANLSFSKRKLLFVYIDKANKSSSSSSTTNHSISITSNSKTKNINSANTSSTTSDSMNSNLNNNNGDNKHVGLGVNLLDIPTDSTTST